MSFLSTHSDYKKGESPRFGVRRIATAFTLVELMITVAIATVIMAVVLFNNAQFNSSIILTNAAYEVALTIRQAQVYGLSTRAVNVGGSGPITQSYGVYTSIKNETTNKNFYLFADINNDDKYQSGEVVTGGVTLGRGLYIKDICFNISNAEHCYSEDSITYSTYVSNTILFQRPDPEAVIREAVGGSDDSTGNEVDANYSKIILGVSGDDLAERCVIAYNSGQISVKSKGAPSCL